MNKTDLRFTIGYHPPKVCQMLVDAGLVLRLPLWAGPSHVMKLGPIGIAGDLDQPAQLRHEHIQWLER
jgi:hypothetical protein